MVERVTVDDINKACEVLYASPDIIKTPLLCHVQKMFPGLEDVDLYLKLENTQTTGSFKIRGVTNQMDHLPAEVSDGTKQSVTLSAGNYGKAFAYCMHKKGLKGLVLMPHTAPDDRVTMIKYIIMVERVTVDDINEACEVLYASPDIIKTPLLCHVQKMFPGLEDVDLYLKLENTQTTGSFKIRGVTNQMDHLPAEVRDGTKQSVTLSAGNYGKAFAYCMHKKGLKGLVLMPHTAPDDRVTMIKSFGIEALKVPSSELQEHVDSYVAKGYTLLHSFDDVSLIAGYASIALEILKEVPDPDVVAVCCGGGGLVAGVAAGLKLFGSNNCRVYAVEPTGAPTMYESYKAGHAVKIPTVKSVATGLMPPYAGDLPYELCKKYVEEVLLVTDEEMVQSMKLLYDRGLKVEPAGSAAFTALVQNKIPNVKGKKVVIVLTGGNITPQELAKLIT